MLSGDKTRVCIFEREQYISRHEMRVATCNRRNDDDNGNNNNCGSRGVDGVYARHALGIVDVV
jgi:hypothetical protein